MERKTVIVSISMSEEVALKTRIEAAKMNMSRSQFIVWILKRYFEEKSKNET